MIKDKRAAVGLGILISVVVFAVAGSIMLPVIIETANLSAVTNVTTHTEYETVETIVDNIPIVFAAILILGMLIFLAEAAD